MFRVTFGRLGHRINVQQSSFALRGKVAVRGLLAAYYRDRMATTKPLPAHARSGRLPRRPQRFAPYRIARFILVVLALIGTVAIALLVLGLLNVHVVTNHFRIH